MTGSLKKILGAAALALAIPSAFAADPLRFALCYDLTKAYTFVTPQFAQAAKDYAALLNLRGGIEGQPIEIIVQDHGNEPQRGIECYERVKGQALTIDTLSTPVSRAVLPRAMKDGEVMIQAMVGRGDAVDGDVFKWVFPLGPTYWGQAANIVSHYKNQAGGNLKGKKIAFLYIDYPFGQEPIPVMQELAKREGFDLQLFPYPLPGSDQSSAWSQLRRFQPDLVVHWAFSAMHVVAAKEAKRNGVPLDRIISVNWLNDVDIANIGPEAAKGLRRATPVLSGTDHPTVKAILSELYDKGKGNGDRKFVSDIYYTLGLATYATVFEGARIAIKNEKLPLTAEKMRKGLESIKNYDAGGLMPALTVTAKDHGGGGKTRIERWDGTRWVPEGEWTAGYSDLIWSTVKQHSGEFAKSGGAK
ncbi:ABC transporter substrate-binding protein [Ramlibacter albus]|uniref:ABC transporter substrate-binding protein n=1 Tax=Ramlibacter albus TaxID=2079448 RepID=A0A923M5D7_9BURK|nr:ABC transporter substrate-binding protein [Ramlibacter albus]MBC5762974.1 ABC transporter substrate-binding protein [Ramlibacter albus]